MFRLNNKGQSLVMFIVLIPILALLITLVYDVGVAIYEKNNLSNTSYMIIDYGLDNLNSVSEGELMDLVIRNTDNLSYISVVLEDDSIEIILKKNIKGIIGKLFGFDLVEVSSHYTGNVISGKKNIERN